MFLAAIVLAILGGGLCLLFPATKTSAKDLDRAGPFAGIGIALDALFNLPHMIGTFLLILAAIFGVLGFFADSIPMPHITWS